MPRIRVTPEDFRVEEIPLYPAHGAGDHTFVWIEKRLRTTEQVARDLARAAGTRPGDVGYAGRKDRVSVSRQWLSVPGLDPERARGLELAGATVLEASRHPHKLRTGHLRANRFEIVVRDVAPDEAARASARLDALVAGGMRNRFGGQRFGAGGDNAERAGRLLSGESAPRDRRAARFLLSALQAAVFNDVLAARSRPDVLEPGDVAVVHATGGLFVVEDPEAEAARAASFDVSPTGPIFGTRVVAPSGDVARREAEALRAHGVDPARMRPPRGVRLRGARRALRIRPQDASLEARGDVARLCVTLPPGSYATVLLEELFPGAIGLG